MGRGIKASTDVDKMACCANAKETRMTINAYFQWLKRDWAKAGFILSIFLFNFLFTFVREADFVIFILLLQTPLYMLHETEEYIFPGGFAKFFNTKIFKLETEDKPLDEDFIFYVNIALVWILLPTCGLLAINDYDFGLWIPYFSIFAGVNHIALGIKAGQFYNPGLFISLTINIPVGLWSVFYLLGQGILENFLNVHFMIGLAVNGIVPIMGVVLLRNFLAKS